MLDVLIQARGGLRKPRTRCSLEKLEDGEHAVVHVAEARGTGLVGVVETALPIDHNVSLAVVEDSSTACVGRGSPDGSIPMCG